MVHAMLLLGAVILYLDDEGRDVYSPYHRPFMGQHTQTQFLSLCSDHQLIVSESRFNLLALAR